MMLDRVEAVPADASEHDEKRCHVSGKNWKELENDPDIVQNGSLWVQHIPPSLDIALTSYGVAQKSQRLRLTAYVGLEVVAKVQAGEKLVVSGAAGAVGSLVCQIGKEKGAKVYAIAGSAEKCAWLEQDVGVDKALNYKSPTFHDDFANAVGSFDLFFDNVGGELLDYRMNLHARVIICGMILIRSRDVRCNLSHRLHCRLHLRLQCGQTQRSDRICEHSLESSNCARIHCDELSRELSCRPEVLR
ncbi:hypothetical protein AcV7_007032 [Taiwanofungus camphoratus]|nr:hypothetical protein AcV7_007032 [Antrodia cinnamomea]